MDSWTQVSIDFETSHLVFPTIVAVILLLLGAAIVIRDRQRILKSYSVWRGTMRDMDKARFFGTLALTLAYFSLMVPVGNLWPNTGAGFLICSVPYVLGIGVLYLHERTPRTILPVAILSVTAPPAAWWLFSYMFFLTLP